MSNYSELLHNVKQYVEKNEYKLALNYLEKLLMLLKADYDAGVNRVKSGLAFNKLLQVRKDLMTNKLSDSSYEILGLKKKEEIKEAPKAPDYSKPSSFFDDIEEKEEPKEEPKEEESPEEKALEGALNNSDYPFNWDDIPTVTFEDIAGLDEVKDTVRIKVLMPLLHPEAFQGYVTTGGGGLCLYGPPGTGKTMVAAAIANTIHAKFCTVTPSDLLQQGVGNTEKAVKALFAQARSFKCAVIFFDEMDSIAPKNTRAQAARQLRSELLAQLQGIQSYGKKKDNILFLICATNKPWDIDSAFLRPGRFGTKIYVTLPDYDARKYMIDHRLNKIKENGIVKINSDIDVDYVVNKTNGFNCADITNLLAYVEELSVRRAFKSENDKYICDEDFKNALKSIKSSVQADDILKLSEWRRLNDFNALEENEAKADESELDKIKEDSNEVDPSSFEEINLEAPEIDFKDKDE